MREKNIKLIFLHLLGKYSSILLTAVLFGLTGAMTVSAQDGGNFESSAPVLISEADSIRALAVNPDNWRGALPGKSSENFQPGARVVLFVTNISLLEGEGANAFRAIAEDANEKDRLQVESIQPVPKRNWIYALTLRLTDANGYNGQPANGELSIRVAWRGNVSNRVYLGSGRLNVKNRNGEKEIPTPAPLKPPVQTEQQPSFGDRKRFMQQASFGPTDALDFRLRQIGIRRWIDEQFYTPYPTIPYPNFPLKPFIGEGSCGTFGSNAETNLCHRNHYWNYQNQKWMVQEALYGEAQLRRRVSWALHQIWVVSHNSINQQRGMQEYIETLDRNAFGNYRDLMKEMTLNPAMGEYLDMVRSTRRNPNENYPRELLQLFSIGLYMLNQDGTLKLDGQGNRIPTFDQNKIDQFTKVFTGWTHCNSGNIPTCPNAVVGAANFIDPMYPVFPDDHDTTAKTLFDYPGAPNPTISACANCTTDAARLAYSNDSLDKTLDNIFHRPNVGPFIGKLLIQHLVTGNPSPAYVARVAAAFNNNGNGTRGDMKAVIKAVLLDPEARGGWKTDPTYGKLREPLQHITNLLRTFNVGAGIYAYGYRSFPPESCQNRSDGVFEWLVSEAGQDVWAPPTVFNYFPPEYVVPGTDILGPEFALANTGFSFARNNSIYLFTLGGGQSFEDPTPEAPYPYVPCGTSIDLSEEEKLVRLDPTSNMLIESLNMKMMSGTMSEEMKNKIRAAVTINVPLKQRAKQAVYLIASSSQYQIQK